MLNWVMTELSNRMGDVMAILSFLLRNPAIIAIAILTIIVMILATTIVVKNSTINTLRADLKIEKAAVEKALSAVAACESKIKILETAAAGKDAVEDKEDELTEDIVSNINKSCDKDLATKELLLNKAMAKIDELRKELSECKKAGSGTTSNNKPDCKPTGKESVTDYCDCGVAGVMDVMYQYNSIFMEREG